jgi:hypothetical protein
VNVGMRSVKIVPAPSSVRRARVASNAAAVVAYPAARERTQSSRPCGASPCSASTTVLESSVLTNERLP